MSKLHELTNLGQSIWLDYIRRSFLISGDLENLIKLGVRGMTSNPTIFEKAINGSTDYDKTMEALINDGYSVEKLYESLTIEDIQKAADLLYSVYTMSGGDDGYVSLEVNPNLAYETKATIDEVHRLWSLVKRPNLMIKIPATEEGLPAITQAIHSGINVNVTLIFSILRYQEVVEAYLQGLESRLKNGDKIDQISSVASFFVSRLDSKMDQRLTTIIKNNAKRSSLAKSLLGKTAISNAKLAYQKFKARFESNRFRELEKYGAKVQRPLWASTSTKNPEYSDILYVQELIGQNTVNTLPQGTLEAFLDHGQVILTIEKNLEEANEYFRSLKNLNISIDSVTAELEKEGVRAFSRSFNNLLDSIARKREAIISQKGHN
jgi:transaldolase